MDWFKRLVSKDPPAGAKSDASVSSDSSPTPSSTPSPSPNKPVQLTKEDLKRQAEVQKAKEKELLGQLNLAWKHLEDCNPKDRPAKHAALMHMFLTLYDEHRFSFKTIRSGFPGLTSGFQTAVCSFLKDGFHNIMNHGTPNQSPKKRRNTQKLDKAAVQAAGSGDLSSAHSFRLYSFLDKEAYDTLRVLLILSQELVEVNPLVAADMPTVLVNIFQRLWQLPDGVILSRSERAAKVTENSDPTSSSSSDRSPSPLARPQSSSSLRPSPEELLISVLLQLCSSKVSIQKLTESDAFARLFIMPLMHCGGNASLRDRILPVTSTVIKYHIDRAVIDYMMRRESIMSIVEVMANNFENFTPSNIVDSCTMILTLLEESVKVSPELIDEFNNRQGYNLLTKALVVLEDQAPGSDHHTQLIEYVKEFVFVWAEPLYPEFDDENPYNPPPIRRDPLTGRVIDDPNASLTVSEDGTKLRRVRNAEAFQVMQNCFFGSKHDKTKEMILDGMVALFSAHPGNFYALQHLRTLAHFVEALPMESSAVRDGIHQLVLCCATYINVIPFYALVSLWNVFSESVPKAKMSVIEGVFNTFLVLLNYDPMYRTILTRAGILDGLIEVLQRYHKAVAKMLMNSSKLNAKGPVRRPGALKRTRDHSSSVGTPLASGPVEYGSMSLLAEPKRGAGSGSISLRKFGARGALARLKMERMREQTRVCEELLADKSIESLDINKAFPAVTDLLSLMVTEHPENASKLKKANGSQALHNLMQQTETRSGALTILVQLIKHDESQTEGDMGNLLITLSSHSDIELRRDILLALLDLFKATPATKRSFREFGGFASVMTTVVLLRSRLDTITMKNDDSGYKYFLDTLQLTLCVVIAAISNHRVNRLHMAANGGWPLLETSIKETGLWESNPEMYIDFLFQLATEDIQYVQTIPSSASTYAKSKLAKDAATLLSDNGALLEAQQKAYKKRTGRYKNAVLNYIDFYASQNLTSTGEVVAEPKDLLSILLAMDSGEHVDQPADFKSTWMHILPIMDRQHIIFNPGPLSSILNLISHVPISVPTPLGDYKEHEDETESHEEGEASSPPSAKPTPSKPSSVSPQQVIWHLHIFLRLTDFARGNVGNLEALSSLGFAGKVMRKWSSHIRNLGSPLNPLLMYLVELEMAYRPDTLEVTQYLGLFEPSAVSARALQALLQSLHRSTVSGLARIPPFFLFDLSRHGFGSMSATLSEVQWPCSDGYTISTWCYFDRFSPDDLELIRIAPQAASTFHPTFSHAPSNNPSSLVPPASQCIVSIVLRTGQLIFRSAGAEEPLTVETFNFATGRWYHVAIVHERSKFGFSNNVDTKVYIDGVVRGSIKANMGTPVNNTTLTVTLGTTEEVFKSHTDSSFFHGVSSAWRLGPFSLLDQALQNVDILTIFNLGPSYYASFQGSLAGHFAPEVINSQYLLALEDIRGEPIVEADEAKLFLHSSFNVDRMMVNINAMKHVLQMHPSSRNLPNFAFLRDPSGKRGIAPLFATTSDAIRGTSAVVTTPAPGAPDSAYETDGPGSLKAARRISVDIERLGAIAGSSVQKELGDGEVSDSTALVNAAGVLAGLGSPIEGTAGPIAVGGTGKAADNTRPPLTLHFENGDSPIACWPQPLQTVLYRSNGIDMLTYLFEFVAACEVSTVQSMFLSTASSGLGSASMTSLPSENDESSMHTPPSSARQSSQLGSATPSTPTLPADSSMALLVLRCIRAILRSNPQSYSDVLEKNVYNAIAHVLKRFPQQLTEEKLKLFFDMVGVVPNGFTSANASAAQEEAMSQFLTNYDSSVLNSIPKPISESLWSLALHRILPGSLSTSTVSNVAAFKGFFMAYRLWRKAPLRLQEMHLEYIDHLIQDNLLFQFNVGRLRKTHLLSYLLNVLREDSLDMTLFIRVVGLVSDLLVAHHTEKDLNHVAGFLVHSFHLQNNPPAATVGSQVDPNDANNRMEQLAIRFDILRNMIMSVVYYLVADAEHKSFYESVFDPDWLNLFITQETNPDTVTIAFKILAQLYYGSSSYSLKVDKTNILKNLSTILPVFHSHAPLYFYLFGMTFGKPPTEISDQLNNVDFSVLSEVFKLLNAEDEYHIACRGSLEVIFAMIKASSEAFIEINDGPLTLHSPSSPALTTADFDSSSAGLGATSSYDNLASLSSLQSDQSSEEESPRRYSVEAILKSASATAVNSNSGSGSSGSGASNLVSPAQAPLTTRRSADVAELSRRRAISLALPRAGASSGLSTGGTGVSEDTISEEPETHTDDSSATGPSPISMPSSGLTNLVSRGGIAAATMSNTLLGVFKGSKSSKRKSMVINQYVPQQVIGGTMSGAMVTNRVYPKFQDKFRLYSPPVYYQEQSQNLSANFSPHRLLIQFLRHVFARSSAMQDLVRKGDLAHLIVSVLFPLGKLNLPHSGTTWNSSISAGHALASSTGTASLQSGADQWSLLIMEFLAQILINQSILNPTGPKDNALLHEVFEIAPPQFPAHSDLLRFNTIMLHYLFDQIRAKMTFVLASTAHNTLAKLLAPLGRFCSFAIDRIACCWTQAGFASLTLTFICDTMTTIQDKMEEEKRKGTLASKDSNAIKAELNSFTKSLNRLVLHMIHEPLREKVQNQSSAQKLAAMGKVMAQKNLWVSVTNNDKDFFGTLCKALHTLLMDSDVEVRNASIAMWKIVLSAKMEQVEFGLTWKNQKGETIDLRSGFMHLVQPATDTTAQSTANANFIKWFKDSSLVINTIFEDHFGKVSRNYWINELKLLEERKALSKKHAKTRDGRTNKSLEVEKITRKRVHTDNARLQQRILFAEMAKYQQTKHDVIDLERYYQRKWAQRRVTLFHDLHIWSPVTQDPDTDSPLHPGLAPVPHHLHKWALDLTEGPNRMRSKTRRNDDFYAFYPFDPTNLQATAAGPIIYPTRTPQSTSAKLFAALSEDERVLVDLNYFVQRSLRRHQLLAAAQMRSIQAAGILSVPVDHEGSDGEETESEGTASSRTGSLVVSREMAGNNGSDGDDLDDMDPEQAALERLNRLGKMIPASQRHTAADDAEDEEHATLASSSGRRGRATSILSGKSSSRLSVSESKSNLPKKGAASAESDDDTANDLNSQIDDESTDAGYSKKSVGPSQAEEATTMAQLADEQDAEDDVGDQKLKRLLQPGDEPTDMYNCGRVVGLDKMDGIFVVCQNNAYFIQDYHITHNHELIEVTRPGGGFGHSAHHDAHAASENRRRVLRWAHVDLEQVLRRRYLLRPVAIEIFSVDGRNSLLVFDLADRERVINVMGVKQQAVANRLSQTTGVATSAKSLKLSLKESTDMWSSGQISNFEYLMRLNTIAGRSYNDLTQYPVFPWIVADYTSQTLDLSNPASFRDLTKPMGALGEERRERLLERYEMLDDSVPRFHYGSHYSSAAIVLHYLIRLEPMTQQFLTLQGGRFDRPDRLFESVGDSWVAASSENPMDVKELVPEFYYLPEAFLNTNNFIFGRKQTGDEAFIDDVVLPPWAHGDPHTFVRLNRQALESPYVSENLHHWIDLIFGFKQQGQAAEAAMNLFYYLTYEGAVDIDKITDAVEKQGIVDQINNFGQTPTQLFKKAHPKRQIHPKLIPSLFGVASSLTTRSSAGAASTIASSSAIGATASTLTPAITSASSGSLAPSSSSDTAPTSSSSATSSNPPSSDSNIGVQSGSSAVSTVSTSSSNPDSEPSSVPKGSDKPGSLGLKINITKAISRVAGSGDAESTSAPVSPSSSEPPTPTSAPKEFGAVLPTSRMVIQCSAMLNKGVASGLAIGEIVTNVSDKVVALEMMKVSLPGHLSRRIAWGYDDMALRFWDNDRLVHVVPNVYHRSGIISCVTISSDGKYVVTGGTDAVLCVFRLDWEGKRPIFQLASAGAVTSKLTGHCAPIAHVTVSRAFSMIVSADTMGQVLIWDLNTFQFTRTLCGPLLQPAPSSSHAELAASSGTIGPGTPRSVSKRMHIYHEHQYSVDGDIRAAMAEASVEDGLAQKSHSHTIDLIQIDDSCGNIYTSSQGLFCIWDINGELLACEEVSKSSTVSSFISTSLPEWMDGVNFLVLGFKDGSLRIYRQDTNPRLDNATMIEGKWPILPPGNLILHTQFADKHKAPVTALCLSPNQKKLYSGDANGVLFKWEEVKVSD